MSKATVVNELHKPARKNFKRKRTIIKGFDDLWQTDLAEFIPYARDNKGYKYVLVVIDCYSKYLWTRPLKSKTGVEVTKAFTDVLKHSNNRKPKNLQSDQGKEFYNTHFQALMKKHNINHYSTYSVKKAAIAERVIRTIKEKLYKLFSLQGKYKWHDQLQQITDNYNNRKHGSTSMSPADVKPSTSLTVYDNIKTMSKQKFNTGDFVRISKFKSIFAKGYTPNWSTELFKIYKIKVGNPVTYLLEDTRGHPIQGQFYAEELQKTKAPDVYLVEKVLRKKGNQLYVRWLGFDKSHDQWINKNDIMK